MSGFAISLLLAPVLAVAFGLAMFWLAGWLDHRDEQRHHAAE
jgi:hypothetical protein